MQRTIEIAASFTGTIPTGSYENEKPFYSVKEIINLEKPEDMDWEQWNKNIGELTRKRQQELHQICYDQFKRQAEISYSERIAKQYQNIRFYDGKDGIKYPSVTSIVGLDKEFGIPEEELAQYGARGTCYHKQAEIFLTTNEWKDIKDIAEVSTEYMTVIRGSLGLSLDDVDFKGFYKDYPFKVLECEKTIYNHDYKYAGKLDILCIIESTNKGKWEKIEETKYDIPTILDIKTSTSLDKIYGLTQQAAYAKPENVEQIGLIHLTKDNKCGYAKPIITCNTERYWDLFYKKLAIFRKRYGV